jgi:hypothetical protein
LQSSAADAWTGPDSFIPPNGFKFNASSLPEDLIQAFSFPHPSKKLVLIKIPLDVSHIIELINIESMPSQ